jgi:hypothetical protein
VRTFSTGVGFSGTFVTSVFTFFTRSVDFSKSVVTDTGWGNSVNTTFLTFISVTFDTLFVIFGTFLTFWVDVVVESSNWAFITIWDNSSVGDTISTVISFVFTSFTFESTRFTFSFLLEVSGFTWAFAWVYSVFSTFDTFFIVFTGNTVVWTFDTFSVLFPHTGFTFTVV